MTSKRPYSTTKVPVERSRADIEKLLKTAGVSKIRVTINDDDLMLEFVYPVDNGEIPVRVQFPMTADAKENRRLMRVALNWMKNRIEAVLDGFRTAEEEFLGEIVTQRGTTVAEELLPQIMSGRGELKFLPPRRTNAQVLRGE